MQGLLSVTRLFVRNLLLVLGAGQAVEMRALPFAAHLDPHPAPAAEHLDVLGLVRIAEQQLAGLRIVDVMHYIGLQRQDLRYDAWGGERAALRADPSPPIGNVERVTIELFHGNVSRTPKNSTEQTFYRHISHPFYVGG